MQTKRRWERGKTRLADAPCRPRTPAREGKVGGGGTAFPRAVPLTHPQLPLYQLPYAGVRTRWRAPRIRPRTVTQPPALSKAREADSQVDGGVQDQNLCTTLAHPEQPIVDRGASARDPAAELRRERAGSQCQPASRAEREGGGPR